MSASPPRFDIGAVPAHWVTLDDNVMGGHSRSRVTLRGGVLVFSGTTSLGDNGGFASIRARGAFDFDGALGLRLRLRGDGRRYQLRLATDARYRGSKVSWRGEVAAPADTWTDAVVAFDRMQPTYRGTVLDGPALMRSKVEDVGVLVGDGRAGPFMLQIAGIAPVYGVS